MFVTMLLLLKGLVNRGSVEVRLDRCPLTRPGLRKMHLNECHFLKVNRLRGRDLEKVPPN